MSVKHAEDVTASDVASAQATTIQVLISSNEGPNFAMRRFVMQPGGGMPRHTNLVEHEQYVLNGQALITIGGETFSVKRGDVILIPALIPHSYLNNGKGTFEFLCMVPNKPDEIRLMDEEC